MTGAAPGRWDDLQKRVTSAAVLIAVGLAEIWLGGPAFAALVIVLSAVMMWELATMTAPRGKPAPVALAVIAGACMTGAIDLRSDLAAALLILPALAMALTPRRIRRACAVYAIAIMIAGYGLITLREGAGTPAILWLVLLVVASDVLGYFVGRSLGGPKFWPAISPKKTWSGTVAGWIGAGLVGVGFWVWGWGAWVLIPLSALLAFAGQLGDIGESWIKRRVGVKDASDLIPGHGGVMDRFDALIGAVTALMLIELIADILPHVPV